MRTTHPRLKRLRVVAQPLHTKAAAAHLDGEAVNGLRVVLAFELQFDACPNRDTEPVRHALREHDLTPRGLGL